MRSNSRYLIDNFKLEYFYNSIINSIIKRYLAFGLYEYYFSFIKNFTKTLQHFSLAIIENKLIEPKNTLEQSLTVKMVIYSWFLVLLMTRELFILIMRFHKFEQLLYKLVIILHIKYYTFSGISLRSK